MKSYLFRVFLASFFLVTFLHLSRFHNLMSAGITFKTYQTMNPRQSKSRTERRKGADVLPPDCAVRCVGKH